jgi:RHS repeat-associated protein
VRVTRHFVWGPDIAGQQTASLESGAEGVGGLLLIREWKLGRGMKQYLPLTDGLGSVCGLIDATDGSLAAEYDYDPYGGPVIERGIAADACPFRHRTRYYDSESWLYYYGYRYYDPSTTKWISKDPLGEAGGWNLTCFCDNDPVNNFDPTGLEKWSPEWDTDPVAKKHKEVWLGTTAGQKLLAEIRELEKSILGKDFDKEKYIVEIIFNPKSDNVAEPKLTPNRKLQVFLNGELKEYLTDFTKKYPKGEVMSVPGQALHHELAHAAKRLEYGIELSSWQTYSWSMQREFLVKELKKFRNPTEFHSLYHENEYLDELRKGNNASLKVPRRSRYELRSNEFKKKENEECYFRGQRPSLLPDETRKLYEIELKNDLECWKEYKLEEDKLKKNLVGLIDGPK